MTATDIKAVRWTLRLTLRALGAKVGCTASHLCDIEHNRRRITQDLGDRLAGALGIPGPDAVDTIIRTWRLPRQPTRPEATNIARVLKLSTRQRK